jgi:hypothetical protein
MDYNKGINVARTSPFLPDIGTYIEVTLKRKTLRCLFGDEKTQMKIYNVFQNSTCMQLQKCQRSRFLNAIHI